MGSEVMQGHDALNGGSKRGGDFRIAHIGDVMNAFYFEVMNLGMKSLAYLSSGSGKINHDAAGVIDIYFEAV